MYLRSWVGCGVAFVLALASLGCDQPTEKPSDKPPAREATVEDEELTPAHTEVTLHVVCPPPQASTAVKIFLRPQNRGVNQNVDVYWTRTTAGGGTHSSTFSIQPQNTTTWPWTDGEFPWSHATRIDGTAKTNHPLGEYKYNITFECNGDKVVLDPRMIIN